MSDYEDYIRDKGFGNSGFFIKNTSKNSPERKKAIKLALETIEKYHGKEKFEQLKAKIEQKRLERLKQS